MVTLYTVQHRDVVDTLSRGHVYVPSWTKCHLPEFEPAYRWLCRYLRWKDPPVWLWPNRDDVDEEFDDCHQYAVITIKTEESPFYFNFHAWHAVLNNSFLSFTDEELDAEHTQEEIRESWLRLFQPFPQDAEYGDTMQALLPRLYPEDVFYVDFLA